MSKIYHIKERKTVVYTYEVYASDKDEALRKFNSHGEYMEIGMDSAGDTAAVTVEYVGQSRQSCAACGENFSPENIRDFLCSKCGAEEE